MMRTEDETSSFAPKKLSNGLDFFGRCFLVRDHVVEAKNHNRIGVCEHALVQRKLEPCLVDALKHRDGMAGSLLNKLLKWRPCPEEQFQRSRNALLKL